MARLVQADLVVSPHEEPALAGVDTVAGEGVDLGLLYSLRRCLALEGLRREMKDVPSGEQRGEREGMVVSKTVGQSLEGSPSSIRYLNLPSSLLGRP